jgi:hypothetical protein
MKIKELRELLEQYPPDAKVFVNREIKSHRGCGTMRQIEAHWVIDQDSNEGSLCLAAKLEPGDFDVEGTLYC